MDDEKFMKEVARIQALAEEEPPRSNVFQKKHEARSELTDLRTKLTDLCKAAKDDEKLLVKLIRTNIMIAGNLFEVESFDEGYEYVERAETMAQALRNCAQYDWEKGFLKGQLVKLRTRFAAETKAEVNQAHTPTLLELFNLAGYFWTSKGKTEQALELLKHSEKIYADFDTWAKAQGDDGVQKLSVSDEGEAQGGELALLRAEVEKTYTSTLFYLAQVYGNDSRAPEASKYCHLTLHRQLASKAEFDRLEWSVNALGLCSFYLSNNDFGAALHCIEAAEEVIQRFVEKNTRTEGGKRVPVDPSVDDERMNQTEANIQQAKGKWAYYLVKYYRDKHQGMGDDEEPAPPESMPVDWFIPFPNVPEPAQPKPIPKGADGWPVVLELWGRAKTAYQRALEWYTFDNFVTDYIQICQDLSSFLKIIAYWDVKVPAGDPYGLQIDRHVAIHRERLALLEHIPSGLSTKHYLNFCRQVWFEVGETYSEMAELRVTQRGHRQELGGTHPVSKKGVNKLVNKALKAFGLWVDSFKEEGEHPENMDPDLVPAYVSARVNLARLGTKLYAFSAEAEYKQLELATVEYNQIISWWENYPQQEKVKDETVKLQLDLAREMARLLPGKMRDIQRAFMRSAA